MKVSVIQSAWDTRLADQFINLLLTMPWNRATCQNLPYWWSGGTVYRLSKSSLTEIVVYLQNFVSFWVFIFKLLTIVYCYNWKTEYFSDKRNQIRYEIIHNIKVMIFMRQSSSQILLFLKTPSPFPFFCRSFPVFQAGNTTHYTVSCTSYSSSYHFPVSSGITFNLICSSPKILSKTEAFLNI